METTAPCGANGRSAAIAESNLLRLDVRAIWMHDFLDGGVASVTSNFVGAPGAGFAVQAADLGRDFAVASVSLSRSFWNGSVRLFAGYPCSVGELPASLGMQPIGI